MSDLETVWAQCPECCSEWSNDTFNLDCNSCVSELNDIVSLSHTTNNVDEAKPHPKTPPDAI